MAEMILLVCTFFTIYAVGMIWTLQLNHYPLYNSIAPEDFKDYMAAHNRRLLLPIVLPSAIAFATAIVLLFLPPAGVSRVPLAMVVCLNIVIALSTAFVQGPAHRALEQQGYSPALVQRVIRTNWVRTVAWTISGILLISVMRQSPIS